VENLVGAKEQERAHREVEQLQRLCRDASAKDLFVRYIDSAIDDRNDLWCVYHNALLVAFVRFK
jgi:hypothetical protein